jgi:hypothetical protein
MWVQLLVQEHLLVEQIVEEGMAFLLDALDIHEVQKVRKLVAIHVQLLADIQVWVVLQIQMVCFNDVLEKPAQDSNRWHVGDGLCSNHTKLVRIETRALTVCDW